MIKEHYPLIPSKLENAFFFQSIGKKGIILKVIIFEDMENNYYNLAFGDVVNMKLDDKVITNNNDLVMVISTVAKAIYQFIEKHPKAIIEIDPIDPKRRRLYNSVFKRRHLEILDLFQIFGVIKGQKEKYNPNNFYEEFEIHPKKP